MRVLKISILVSALFSGLAAPAIGAPDKVEAPRTGTEDGFQICRVRPHDSDCIRFKKDCQGGVTRVADGETKACRMPGAPSCRGIEKLLQAASKRLGTLPADRVPASGDCAHFTLNIPGKSQSSGCVDGKSDSAKLLFNVFMGIEPLCRAE